MTDKTTSLSSGPATGAVLQQIDIAPKDLMTFKGTFEEEINQELTITNPTDAMISFKLKGTSPALIRQRPGFGYIPPKGKQAITVTIGSLKGYKKLPGKQRITTLLVVAPNEKPANAMDLWKDKTFEKDALRKTTKLKFKRKEAKKDKKDKKAPKEEKEEESEDANSDASDTSDKD